MTCWMNLEDLVSETKQKFRAEKTRSAIFMKLNLCLTWQGNIKRDCSICSLALSSSSCPFHCFIRFRMSLLPSFVVWSFVIIICSQSRHHLIQTMIVALSRFSSCTPQTTIAYLWITLVSNSLVQAWHKQIHHQSSCDYFHQHFSYTRWGPLDQWYDEHEQGRMATGRLFSKD